MDLIFFQTGDRSGELTARMNVSDLQTLLGLSYSTNNSTLSENREVDYNQHGRLIQSRSPLTVQQDEVALTLISTSGAKPRMSRRLSMENLELMKLTPDKMNVRTSQTDVRGAALFCVITSSCVAPHSRVRSGAVTSWPTSPNRLWSRAPQSSSS